MTTVTETLQLPEGARFGKVTLSIAGEGGRPLPEAYGPDGTRVGAIEVFLDEESGWSTDLLPNDAIVPAGTRWRRDTHGAGAAGPTTSYALIPDSGAPVVWTDYLSPVPGVIPDPASAFALTADLVELRELIELWLPDEFTADGGTDLVNLPDLTFDGGPPS